MNHADPLTQFDWAAHWRRLVEARETQVEGARGPDFWDKRAKAYAFSLAQTEDPLLGVLEPFLKPQWSLIDVGAGSGRHASPLAGRLAWVTAVEPSEVMRSLIPHADNMTVIASAWEDAEVAPAELALSAHVLYPIADPVPFIEKLESHARERVFIALRDSQLRHPAEQLWEQMTGQARARQPQFYDAYNLLHWMGIHPEVDIFQHVSRLRFADLEQAVEDCRLRVGPAWDGDRGRQWLRAHLVPEPDGALAFPGGTVTIGVAHWQPRAR